MKSKKMFMRFLALGLSIGSVVSGNGFISPVKAGRRKSIVKKIYAIKHKDRMIILGDDHETTPRISNTNATSQANQSNQLTTNVQGMTLYQPQFNGTLGDFAVALRSELQNQRIMPGVPSFSIPAFDIMTPLPDHYSLWDYFFGSLQEGQPSTVSSDETQQKKQDLPPISSLGISVDEINEGFLKMCGQSNEGTGSF